MKSPQRTGIDNKWNFRKYLKKLENNINSHTESDIDPNHNPKRFNIICMQTAYRKGGQRDNERSKF